MTMVAAAGMLFVTSCVKDAAADIASTGDDVTVTFALDTANGIATRAISDGKSVDVLSFDILSNGTSIFNTENPKPETKGFAAAAKEGQPYTLSVSLIKGQSYTFVFWAQNSGCEAYTVEDWTVSVDYSKLTNNLEASDAFYATGEITVSASSVQQVTLRRPFAQLNVGITAEDFNAAKALGLVIETSSVELTGVADEIDLLTGEVTGSETIELAAAAIPAEKLTVGGEEYHYLSMSYILAAEKATVGAAYEFEGSVKVSLSEGLSSVPVQRNWRTNIIGRLLTGTVDFEIVVDGAFGGNHSVEFEWDGESVNIPEMDEEGNYRVTKPSELAGLAKLVNDGDELEGATVYIDGDIDLGGHEFPGIAAGATRDGNKMIGTAFKGTLDGQGHTISNLVVTSGTADEASGFLGSLTGEFKDMTFENVQIDTKSKQAGIVGVVSEGGKISGVKVKSGSINGAQAVGGIAGRLILDGTIENCENHANIESQASNAGGIVGAAYYTEADKKMTVSGCDNYGTVSGKSNSIGGIVGLNCGDVINCNNYGTSVTGTDSSVGGIVGEQKAAGSVTGCMNKADVKGGSASSHYGAGGIVGWVRYASSGEFGSYPYETSIKVSGCTNYGKHISGVTGVGGIVGAWYHDGECYENTSYAETVTASDKFVAGIVGGSQWTSLGSDQNGVDATQLKLTVHDNVLFTADKDITGGSKATYIYINNHDRTEQYDNTNPQVSSVASNDEELAAAVTEANAYIKLAAGEYKLPGGVAEGVTIIGEEGTNFVVGSSKPARYTNVTFKNVTITGSQNYTGMQHSSNLKFEYCTLNGIHFLYAATCEFDNCVFNQESKDLYNVWTYGASDVHFNDCVFNCVGRAVLIYIEGSSTDTKDIYFDSCRFYASHPANDGKAAIEIGDGSTFEVSIKNCTAEGFDLGSRSNNSLWNHKVDTNKVTVYVDGEPVYNN